VTARLLPKGLFFFFDGDNFSALVVPAFGANYMRQTRLATVRASGQVAGFKSVMGAATISASLGMFTFWMWWHFVLLYNCSTGAGDFELSGLIIAATDGTVKLSFFWIAVPNLGESNQYDIANISLFVCSLCKYRSIRL
jgi:hypothetical protein